MGINCVESGSCPSEMPGHSVNNCLSVNISVHVDVKVNHSVNNDSGILVVLTLSIRYVPLIRVRMTRLVVVKMES